MLSKLKSKLFGVLSCLACIISIGLILWLQEPAHEFTVQSIQILPATSQEAKRGYDSKVAVMIMSTGLKASEIKNRVLAGGEIICPDARLLQEDKNGGYENISQKPQIDVVAGSPSVVSFLYNKKNLPLGKITLRGTIKARNTYAIHEQNNEVHETVGVPIQVDIQ